MIREKNKIKVMLSAYGSLTTVSIPTKLHKDSFNFTTIDCLVPKTINTQNNSLVKVYGSTLDNSGNKIWASQTHNLPYERDVVIDGFEYELYSANLPEEFCSINGSLEITFVYCTGNEEGIATSILTSGKLNLYIEGAGFNKNGVILSNYDDTAAKVNELSKTKVDKVESEEGQLLIADGNGGFKPSIVPVKEFEDNKKYIDEQNQNQTEAFENHKNNNSNPHEVTKTQVGLANVDNTSDADKPISTAQQTKFDILQNLIDNLTSIKANKTDVTAEINTAIANLVNSAPETLDTLKEIANWVAEHETDADNMVANISKNASDIANLEANKVNWSDLPEGNLLYDSTGTNEDGALTQKASTEIFETKEDATIKHNTKLNKNAGIENAGKLLVVSNNGEIIPSDLKLTKTTSENGTIIYNLGFVDNEENTENEGENSNE